MKYEDWAGFHDYKDSVNQKAFTTFPPQDLTYTGYCEDRINQLLFHLFRLFQSNRPDSADFKSILHRISFLKPLHDSNGLKLSINSTWVLSDESSSANHQTTFPQPAKAPSNAYNLPYAPKAFGPLSILHKHKTVFQCVRCRLEPSGCVPKWTLFS